MSQDEVPLYQEVLSSFNAEAPTLAPAYTQSVLKESATQTIEIPGALSLLANNISDSESEDAPRVSTENRAIEQPDSRTTSDAVTQKEQLVDSNAGGYCTDEQSVEGDQDNGQLSSELAPPQSNSSWQQLDIGIKNTPKRNLRNLGEATKSTVDLSDLLLSQIMSVGSVLCYKGEEGILLRDGWIEWGQQKHPDLLVWAIDVCKTLGLKEKIALQEDLWTEVTHNDRPLSYYREQFLANDKLKSKRKPKKFILDDGLGSLELDAFEEPPTKKASKKKATSSPASSSKRAKSNKPVMEKSLTEIENEQLREAIERSLKDQRQVAETSKEFDNVLVINDFGESIPEEPPFYDESFDIQIDSSATPVVTAAIRHDAPNSNKMQTEPAESAMEPPWISVRKDRSESAEQKAPTKVVENKQEVKTPDKKRKRTQDDNDSPMAKKMKIDSPQKQPAAKITRQSSLDEFIKPEPKNTEKPPTEPLTAGTKSKVVIASSGLKSKMLMQLLVLQNKLHASIESTVNLKVTHLIVAPSSDQLAPRTMKYLMALALRCYIVSFEWVLACISAGHFVDESPYLVLGDKIAQGAPATIIKQRDQPRLFEGYSMYLFGNIAEQLPELEKLINFGGGRVITEIPVATSINDLLSQKRLVICHADCPADSVTNLIRETGICPIAHTWIFDSLSHNTILDTDYYQLKFNTNIDLDLQTQMSLAFD